MRLLAGALTAIAALPLAAPAQRPVDLPTLTELVSRAADYVRGYQTDFMFLVADEEYVQTVVSPWDETPKTRTIKGEMFLTFLEVDQEWVAVHDVKEVDGAAADTRLDVRALLAKSAVRSVAADVVANNARYNIGSVDRNINQPTLALLALGARRIRNFSFERGKVDRAHPGGARVTLRFRERGDSPILHTDTRKPVFSRGELVVDAATGRVTQTSIQFEIGAVKAEQSTTYTADERLGLWVPSLYTEQYTLNIRGRVETTTCRAVFSNYQRFGATGRIKK